MKKTLTKIHNLMESKDFEYVAREIVRHYNLPTKVKFTMGRNTNNKDKGDYKFEEDTIYIRPKGYRNNKEFIETLLHEIHHAVRVHRYGYKKFIKKYHQAGQVADYLGKDRYFANKWERKAEGWAKHEYNRYFKDKFFDV